MSQVFFLTAGDWALSFVEEVGRIGSRMDTVSVRDLQRAFQESTEVIQHIVIADQVVLRPCASLPGQQQSVLLRSQASSMGISMVASSIQVTLAGASSVGPELSSRQAVALDKGDVAALDCLYLQWTPSGPLALFFSEVRAGHESYSPAFGQV